MNAGTKKPLRVKNVSQKHGGEISKDQYKITRLRIYAPIFDENPKDLGYNIPQAIFDNVLFILAVFFLHITLFKLY